MRMRILPKPSPLDFKPQNIVRLITFDDRVTLEAAINILDLVREGMAMHKTCCSIYSEVVERDLADGASTMSALCEAFDSMNDSPSDPADVLELVGAIQTEGKFHA